MSEPLFFSFSVLKGTNQVLCHAVIFSSFLVSDNNKEIKICALTDDPRMAHFTCFAIDNYGKKTKDALAQHIKDRAEEIDKLERKLITLRRAVNQAIKESRL